MPQQRRFYVLLKRVPMERPRKIEKRCPLHKIFVILRRGHCCVKGKSGSIC